MSTINNITIRNADKSDCKVIADLMKELAAYEQMPEQAKLTEADLIRDIFESNPPVVHALVASDPTEGTVGYALYYFNYSMWKGKAIHLEDFYVRPQFRSKGIGTKILNRLAKIAVEGNYARISFECINWNESAIKFYHNLGAENVTLTEKWHSYRYPNDVMLKLAKDQ